jgi:hypothetical protein
VDGLGWKCGWTGVEMWTHFGGNGWTGVEMWMDWGGNKNGSRKKYEWTGLEL